MMRNILMETKQRCKVGILTFHDTTNFGATLQAYATYQAIKNIGVDDVEFIDYRCQNIDAREMPHIGGETSSLKSRVRNVFVYRKQKRKYDSLHSFLYGKCKVSSTQYSQHNIAQAANSYDKYLVGSDMLWCTRFTEHDYTYMLDFVKDDRRKNAFATSVGHDWNEEEVPEIKALLQRFTRLAVREKQTADYLTELLGKKVNFVCDPTMLISPQKWEKYLKHKSDRQGYVLVYMDDAAGNCINNAISYGSEHKREVCNAVFRFNPFKNNNFTALELYSIPDFLSAIHDASILFTASYHGMLFAIYFHVPFVYYNKDSARLENVARLLGLEGRNGGKYRVEDMAEIDWEEVDRKREAFRERSLEILKGILIDGNDL